MGEKLTKAQRRMLGALADRPHDFVDLGDAAGVTHQAVYDQLTDWKRVGYVHWMYADDEACIADAGRRALGEGSKP